MCYDSYGKYIHNFTQWDVNQTITVKDLEFEGTPIFHFSNKNCNRALGVKPTINEDGSITAKVPNSLLQKALPLEIYLYIKTNQSGTTIRHSTIEINSKPKPVDYEYTNNVDVIYIENIVDKIKELKKELQSSVNDVITKLDNGDFNGKDGAPGPQGEKGDKGDPGTTDYWKLENNPFQPVPEAPNPPELLRVPQDLETGAYVFTADTRCYFNNEIYNAGKGELLYITLPYPFKVKRAVIYDGEGVKFTKENDDGYVTVDISLLNDFEQIYQLINLLTEWFMPLFNVSPGQAVTVENADMANLTLELGGMDLSTALPNPNALTIKIGSESVVYDGSSAQTIEIADGNEVAY